MFNDVILVGRLVDEVKLVKLSNNQHVANFTMAVQRPFRNEANEYDTDFIPIQVWRWVADVANQFCKKGSLVLVKGRVAIRISEIQGVKVRNIEIVGERLILLDSKKKESEKVEESEEDSFDNEEELISAD